MFVSDIVEIRNQVSSSYHSRVCVCVCAKVLVTPHNSIMQYSLFLFSLPSDAHDLLLIYVTPVFVLLEIGGRNW